MMTQTSSVADVLKLISEQEVKFVDLRFTDTIGKEQHVSLPARIINEQLFEDGKYSLY
jgi:glutamine synthetase